MLSLLCHSIAVFDIVDKAPEDICYCLLKRLFLSRLSASQDKRLQQLLLLIDLGDRTPSQLLHPMQSLVSKTNLDDAILR
nr:hypothetical protein HmN_000711100 [Hymenolepis microstoma]